TRVAEFQDIIPDATITKGAPMTDMWGTAARTIKDLADSLDTYNWTQARSICTELVAENDTATEPYPEKPARQNLQMLMRERRFDLMELFADAVLQGEQQSAQVRRQYAQCLIDQGKFTAARAVLDLIVAAPQSPETERAEAQGLLGRIYKQLYVNSHDPSNPR